MASFDLVDLIKIGLTNGEAKVYASLLTLGPTTVGPIIKESKIAQSNAYPILQRLQEKGIITTIIRNGITNFQAVDPINLAKYLEKKQKNLDTQKRQLQEALPRIQALQTSHTTQGAQLFTGIRGLTAAYKEFLKDQKPNEENLWIYFHDPKYEHVSDPFYEFTWLPMVKKKRSKGIANKEYRKSPFVKAFKKKHQIKFVDFPIFSHGEVFGDKFLLVSWQDPVIAVLVKAKHVSENFRRYFYEVWSQAKA